jgi:hypothetical protein
MIESVQQESIDRKEDNIEKDQSNNITMVETPKEATKPRLAVSHKRCKKILILASLISFKNKKSIIIEVVDYSKYLLFKKFFELFYQDIIFAKGKQLIKQLKMEFHQHPNLFKIKCLKEDIKIGYDDKVKNVPIAKPRKSIFCKIKLNINCIVKKTIDFQDLQLNSSYLKLEYDLQRIIDNLLNEWSKPVSNYFPVDFNLVLYDAFITKLNNYYQRTNEKKLKTVVDKFHDHFNMDIVNEKLRSEIDKQNEVLGRLGTDKDMYFCVICLDKVRQVLFKPCNHLIYCEGCFVKMTRKQCPSCNHFDDILILE